MAEGLTFVSLLASNADLQYAAMIDELAAETGLQINVVTDPSWAERTRMLRDGFADFGAVCGSTYTRWIDEAIAPVELLAAPVMAAPRYLGRPVYFSDVVVRRDSPITSFADLRGAILAYNDPHSYSGSIIVGAYLATNGETASYFGSVIATGSHQQSLQQVRRGNVDAAIIDSIVLDQELQLHDDLAASIHAVAALGPSPIPPWVAAGQLPRPIFRRLRAALRSMHRRTSGHQILEASQVARFVRINDADYDPIRSNIRSADALQWHSRLTD